MAGFKGLELRQLTTEMKKKMRRKKKKTFEEAATELGVGKRTGSPAGRCGALSWG